MREIKMTIKRDINWKKLFKTSTEEGLKKTLELLILAIIAGAAMKLFFVMVPAVVFSNAIAKMAIR